MISALLETAKRWRLPLVCCAWMLCLSGLLMRRGYETFLSANFLPVIALAALALLPLALCALARRATPRLGLREMLGTAVLLLPLVYIQHSRGATLGSGAFNTRYIGAGLGGGSASGGLTAPDGETTLLTLFMKPEEYEGKSISLVGMLTKDDPQVEQLLGAKQPILFRFAINCCAADALPLAMILEGVDAEGMQNDDWIEASGTFRVRDTGKQKLPVLENAAIHPVKQPAQPYLYSTLGVF